MRHWKKGALHCHSMWSDGRSLPEVVIKTYLDAGYHFVCLSDHNVFQDDPDVWIQVRNEEGPWPPMLSEEEYQRSCEMLPGSIIEKQVSYKKYIHLKTFDELKKEFEIPGEFILVPGTEMTGKSESFNYPGRIHCIHCNVFNAKKTLPLPIGGSDREFLQKMLDIYRTTETEDSFFMLNHPWWNVWDVDPELLIDFPEIRLFEICNSGTSEMKDDWIYNREKYWDFILAHRIVNGSPLLYGTATDDAHFFDPARMTTPGAYETGFVVVDCPGEMTPENLSAAIQTGNFYFSCGVMLEDVTFSKESSTLNVQVKAEPGVRYRIDFISTGKDFDRTMKTAEFPHKNEIFTRTRTVMPEGIGEVVSSVNGTSASYTLKENDLYVRAIVMSDQKTRLDTGFYPVHQCAWTQPFMR